MEEGSSADLGPNPARPSSLGDRGVERLVDEVSSSD
jgi:hypothetical protein